MIKNRHKYLYDITTEQNSELNPRRYSKSLSSHVPPGWLLGVVLANTLHYSIELENLQKWMFG